MWLWGEIRRDTVLQDCAGLCRSVQGGGNVGHFHQRPHFYYGSRQRAAEEEFATARDGSRESVTCSVCTYQ